MRWRKEKTDTITPTQSMFDRPFWRFFSALGDFFMLTVFWLVTSLPLVTLGASTTALFYVCLKKRNREEGTLWNMYKRSFRENLRQASFLWMLYLFIALDVAIVGYTLIERGVLNAADFAEGGRYCPALVAAGLLYFGVMLYTAALLACFRQTNAQCVLAAIGLTFHHIFSTLLFLAILALLAVTTFYLFPALILIDVPLAVYLISIRMNGIFHKQIERVERRQREASEDGAPDHKLEG